MCTKYTGSMSSVVFHHSFGFTDWTSQKQTSTTSIVFKNGKKESETKQINLKLKKQIYSTHFFYFK